MHTYRARPYSGRGPCLKRFFDACHSSAVFFRHVVFSNFQITNIIANFVVTAVIFKVKTTLKIVSDTHVKILQSHYSGNWETFSNLVLRPKYCSTILNVSSFVFVYQFTKRLGFELCSVYRRSQLLSLTVIIRVQFDHWIASAEAAPIKSLSLVSRVLATRPHVAFLRRCWSELSVFCSVVRQEEPLRRLPTYIAKIRLVGYSPSVITHTKEIS